MDATQLRDPTATATPARIQLQLVLPYKMEPRQHPRLRSRLDQGYRIESLQRISDREALVTLVRG